MSSASPKSVAAPQAGAVEDDGFFERQHLGPIEWVIDARDGLRDPERRTDAMTALRAMVEEIVLTPEQRNWELC